MRSRLFVLVCLLVLGGCALVSSDANDYLGRDNSDDTPVLERGSYEDAKVRLDAMMAEMSVALTEAFPECPMKPDPEQGDDVSGGGTNEEEYNNAWPFVMNSRHRLMECTLADTRERADTAISAVTVIAERYGFRPHVTYKDRILPDGEGSISIEGWNADGDSYSFGSIKRTVLDYTTAPRFTEEQLESIRTDPEATPPIPPWSYFDQLDQRPSAQTPAPGDGRADETTGQG